uniref:Uncharacterized protein n=1 Tax=Anopheles culicifacies TaxID=139723 RepID=A0A182MP36_9DIPT
MARFSASLAPPQLPSRTDFFERSKKQAHTKDTSGSGSVGRSGSSVASNRVTCGVRFACTRCSNSHCLVGTNIQSGAAVHHAQKRSYYTNYLLQYISAIGVRWMSFV